MSIMKSILHQFHFVIVRVSFQDNGSKVCFKSTIDTSFNDNLINNICYLANLRLVVYGAYDATLQPVLF